MTGTDKTASGYGKANGTIIVTTTYQNKSKVSLWPYSTC